MNEAQDFSEKIWNTSKRSYEFRHRATLELISKGTILDIGCGTGLLLEALNKKGIDAEGVDFSEKAISVVNEKGLKAVQCDFAVQPLPFEGASFDCVVALDVFEHLFDPHKALEEMVRVTKRNIIIGVPNFSSLPARLQILLGNVPENNLPQKGHVYWFNMHVLRSMVSAQGLEIKEVHYNSFGNRYFLSRVFFNYLAKLWPSMFALSFVIKARK